MTKFSSIFPKVLSCFLTALGVGVGVGVFEASSESTLMTSLIGELEGDRVSFLTGVDVSCTESTTSSSRRFDLISLARLCLLSSAARLHKKKKEA